MPILFQFDVRAVALFVAMTFFVQAAAIGAQAYLIRELKQYRGVGTVLIANLCVALGLILRLFSDRMPGFLSTIVSNILVQAGPALFYVALSQFAGLRYSRVLAGGLIGFVGVSLIYFTYMQDNIGMRLTVLTLGSIVMVLVLIHQLRQMLDTSLRFSAGLMLTSFAVHGLFLVVRSASLLLDPPDADSMTPVQSATFLLSFAISFFWSTGFVLMVSHRLRNDLMEIATIDVLTHIPNRRATQAFIERELSRVQRQGGEFSLMLIDIDNFKQVNDTWGHAVGDFVLSETADTFQKMIRKQDWVGRWGGEEFLMVLPGSTLEEAASLAERIRSGIAAREYHQGAASLQITISIGIACAAGATRIDQILIKADDALYTSKTDKNSITIVE